jgi:hypothetical protein
MSIGGQCCAPTVNNARCLNSTIRPEAMHCEIHYTEGVKSYTSYKALCKLADDFNITKVDEISSIYAKIRFLHKCYKACIVAYNSRMEYRNRFVVPECRDYGHNKQFIIIKERIKQCETLLQRLNIELATQKEKTITIKLPSISSKDKPEDSLSSTKDKPLSEEDKESSLSEEKESPSFAESVMEEIKSFQQKRKDDEQETNKIIATYIKENRKLLNEKRNIVDLYCQHLNQFISKEKKFVYLQMLCMISTITEFGKGMHYTAKKLNPQGKDARFHNDIKYIVLSSKNINRYSNIRDYLMDRQLENIKVLICLTIGDCKIAVNSILFRLTDVWNETTFDPTRSIFRLIIAGGRFNFDIVDISQLKI